MADKKLDEKAEKQFDEKNEKELHKHDEKVEERDTLSSLAWAAVLIWAGLVFLAFNTGWLDGLLSGAWFSRVMPRGMEAFEPSLWGLVMLGAGVIFLIEALARMAMPAHRRRLIGSLIGAAVFIGIGLGNFFGWDLIWPFILIALGVGVLAGGFVRRKS